LIFFTCTYLLIPFYHNSDQCIDPIKKIVRFASLVGGDVDVEIRKDRAYKIISLFEAADFSEESPEDLEAQKQILKTALGLGEST
jgi:hypothetical protein